jgi:peptidoglycan/LPS O-acetylase OafA/YrhL
VASLFLLQAWDIKIAYNMNGVAWSLSCEMAFYAAFPLVLRILISQSPRRRWFLCGGWFILQSAIAVFALATHNNYLQAMGYGDPALRFGEFLIGMAAALEIRRGWRINERLQWIALIVLVAGALGATALIQNRSEALVDALFDPAFLLIIIVAAQRDLTVTIGWLRAKWLVYAGQVSFCFYLVHELILVNLRHEIGAGYDTAALSLAAGMLGAIALHQTVELPCQKLIRRVPLPRRRATTLTDSPA